MQIRDFIICLAVVVIVSVIASLIGISIFQKPVLKAPPQEGTVSIPGGIGSNVDVIIIDGTVVTGVSDAVIFNNVTVGNSYTTDIVFNNSNDDPFVLRNNGNVIANVDISESPGLFSAPDSRLKFWVDHATPYGTAPGYLNLDNCLIANTGGGCFNRTTSPCINTPNPKDSTCVIPRSPAIATRAVNSFEFNDAFDEVYLHILIYISGSEPSGSKNTTLTVTGSQA